MKYKSSAGGVVVRHKNKQLEVLLLQDKTRKWTFPKGLIEQGENKADAAAREIGEEVGVSKLKLIAPLKPVQYYYKWEGELTKKTVHYHIFETTGDEKLTPQREEGIMDVQWFPWERAVEKISYKKTNQPVLEKAREKLKL